MPLQRAPSTVERAQALRVFLFRHGETAWTVSGQYTGLTDLPLTEGGEAEARLLGTRLRALQFDAVFTSPLLRARRTCELAGLGDAAVVDSDLAEWDNGDNEGRTRNEIYERTPGWNLFRDGAPNGESAADLSVRVDRLIARLRTLRGNVAISTHGHTGRVIGARWIGMDAHDAWHLLLDTSALSILCFEHADLSRPALSLWNDRSHLKDSAL